MYYLFVDQNIAEVKKKVINLSSKLLERKPGSSIFRLNNEKWSRELFESLFRGQGLFESNYIVICDQLLTLPIEEKKFFFSSLKEISETKHIFIFIESDPSKSDLQKLEKYSTKSSVVLGKKKKDEFNVFGLTEALAVRNKAQAWEKFHLALLNGKVPEELHGLIFWQLKTLLLAKKTKTALEAGLKSYPYQKAKQASTKFTESELEVRLNYLVDIYHEAHRGKNDLSQELERFILLI